MDTQLAFGRSVSPAALVSNEKIALQLYGYAAYRPVELG